MYRTVINMNVLHFVNVLLVYTTYSSNCLNILQKYVDFKHNILNSNFYLLIKLLFIGFHNSKNKHLIFKF